MKLVPITSTRRPHAPESAVVREPRALQVRANGRRGGVFICGEALANAARLDTRRELIDRLFSITALRAVRLNPVRGSAYLSFESEAISIPEALEALAVALRSPTPPSLPLPHEDLLFTVWADRPFEIWRAERGLTLWQVEEQEPGRFRLSHPLLRHRAIREKILDEISGVAGVTRQAASFARPASIEVWCRPHRINAGILLEVIEPALDDYQELAAQSGMAIRDQLVTANLLLAPISDFFFPPLGIANAVLVWMLNVGHAWRAWQGLRERRCNLELLYLCVGAFTLLTFRFFGAALMYAALELWPKLVRQIRLDGQRQFLARYRRRPQRFWIERDGTLLEAPLAELPTGQVLMLREGDTLPGDGVVLDGRAQVRESWITGETGLADKVAGVAPVYASTELSGGEIRVRIDSVGERTTAARLASWFAQTLRQPSSQMQAERFADAMVLPALLLGAAALGRGGLSMAKAVIRPDYFTGPAIAEELTELLTIIQAADAGFYIADQNALDRLAQSDCWIFDDSVPWQFQTPDRMGFTAKLRAQGVREVYFLSGRSNGEAARLAEELGFDAWYPNFTDEAKKNFIAQRQFLGQSVAYFGDITRQAPAAEQANIAVAVLDSRQLGAPGAPIALILPDLIRCSVLQSLCHARTSTVSTAFLTSVVPNMTAMTGAIYFDFSVVASVILTNLGTLFSYYRWRRTLRSAQ